MRFSIYSEMQHWPGKSTERLYAEVAEQAMRGFLVGNASPLEERAADEELQAAGYGSTRGASWSSSRRRPTTT
jgi:hypothetical protein